MKKSLLLASLIASIALAACGKKEEAVVDTAASEAAAMTEAASEAAVTATEAVTEAASDAATAVTEAAPWRGIVRSCGMAPRRARNARTRS